MPSSSSSSLDASAPFASARAAALAADTTRRPPMLVHVPASAAACSIPSSSTLNLQLMWLSFCSSEDPDVPRL